MRKKKPSLFKQPDDVEAEVGTNERHEADADKLLYDGIGKNRRSWRRDVEKMQYESGLDSALERYDPSNDWDDHESPVIVLVDPADLRSPFLSVNAPDDEFVEDIELDYVDDGNSRARNPAMEQRRALMRQVDLEASGGSTWEHIPMLGVNDNPSGKRCTRCELIKRQEYFAADPRNKKDGLHSWCMACHREHKRITYESRKRSK